MILTRRGRPAAVRHLRAHLFSATAISHGLATWIWLQGDPYNRLTVIKETSLQSNKISNFQLTRDAFHLAVLFSSFLPPTLSRLPFGYAARFYSASLQTLLVLKHFKSKYYVESETRALIISVGINFCVYVRGFLLWTLLLCCRFCAPKTSIPLTRDMIWAKAWICAWGRHGAPNSWFNCTTGFLFCSVLTLVTVVKKQTKML